MCHPKGYPPGVILVVGGAGFIGSHMVRALHQAGEDVLVLDNLEKGHLAALRGAPLVKADLRDRGALDQVFSDHDIEAVLHFAAYIEVGESVQNPARYYENNVLGSLNLAQAAVTAGVKQFVFSSTAAVYGEPVEVPIPEGHPKKPTNPYGNTKLAVERMLRDFDPAYGLKSVCLRYFNAAGSDPDGTIGEDHRPETHLIPRILLHLLGQGDFKVFGNDYDTPDGTCVRDYVHVVDLATAHLLALRYLRDGGRSSVFNLGNGQGHSVNQVLEAVRIVTGLPLHPQVVPRRPGDPARLVASSDRARSVLGWEPQFSGLETMIAHAWAWTSQHPNGYPD